MKSYKFNFGRFGLKSPSGDSAFRSQYRIIGGELLRAEEGRRLGIAPSEIINGFRQGVSFIQVEILESYLDDLLEGKTSEPALGIESKRVNRTVLVSWVCSMVLAGILVASLSRSYFSLHPLVLVACICGMCGFCTLGPTITSNRRLWFAKVISAEITRRRGGIGNEVHTSQRQSLASLFAGGVTPSSHGVATGIVSFFELG